MNVNSRKIDRLELGQKYVSILIAIGSFWIITLFWNYYNFGNLDLVPRLGLAAALSWDVFLHAEAISMLIMTMMKEKWQSEAQDARREARESNEKAQAAVARAQVLEARVQTQEAQAQLQAREAQLQARETQLDVREAQAREAAAQLEAREAQAQAREAQETIRDLRRRLEQAERANGAEA